MERAQIKFEHVTSDGLRFDKLEDAHVHQRRVDYANEIDRILGAAKSLKLGWNVVHSASSVLKLLKEYIDEVESFEGKNLLEETK